MRARAVLVALALAGGSAFAEQPLATYPGTVHTRIGRDLVIGGEYYRIAYFTTPDSIPKVAEYFFHYFSDQGYPTFVDGDIDLGEVIVSAFYTREGLVRSVVLKAHDGKTLGFTVLKDLWMRADEDAAGAAREALVPLEGALLSEDLAHDDGQGTALQRTQVVKGTLESVRQELVQRLSSRGFVLNNETATKLDGKRSLTLELGRPGEQVITSLTAVDDGLVGVYQTWIGSDRPDAVPNDRAVEQLRQKMEQEKVER
ncbi:MAG: hypothetical protein IRZ16_09215 [Myxococcaceae bacterium]|nr:hypothetical protein [Myxococcaceae bacterium]